MREWAVRLACNGSLASRPVQALWDSAQTHRFVHTVSSLCLVFPPFSLPFPLSFDKLWPGRGTTAGLSCLLSPSIAQIVNRTHANDAIHTYCTEDQDYGGGGGAFSDWIPIGWPTLFRFLMGSKSILTETSSVFSIDHAKRTHSDGPSLPLWRP